MCIRDSSGAICGLMGYILTAGISHTLTTTIVDSRGFTAVMVSLSLLHI